MKTKTIIAALFMLFSISSFAQSETETIAWIKEKLEKSLIGYSSFKQENVDYWYPSDETTVIIESIDKCEFVIKQGTSRVIFPTNIESISDVVGGKY